MSFRCNFVGCDKEFSNASHLRRHSRNHQGVSLQCQYCDKKYTRRDVLKRHETLHTRSEGESSSSPRRSVTARRALGQDDPLRQTNSEWLEEAQQWTSSDLEVGGTRSFLPSRNQPDVRDEFDWQRWVEEIFADGNTLWLDSLNGPLPGGAAVQLVQMASPIDKDVMAQELSDSLNSYLPGVQLHIDIDIHSAAEALSQYWHQVDPEYPVLHRATYRPSLAPPILNACLYTCGDILQGNRQRSAIMVPVLRCAVMALSTGTAIQQATFLTAALLLTLAGQVLGQEQRDHSQALIGYSLTLARRANLYDERWSMGIGIESESIEDKWRHWIVKQQLRRVSWAILVRDIEYASFHYQLPSRAASPFRLGIDLPCDEESWTAAHAEQWAASYHPSSSPLAGALYAWMTGSTAISSTHLMIGEYAQLIFVYGLCALGWDMNKRDLLTADVSKCATTSDINKFLMNTFHEFQNSARVAQTGRAMTVRAVAFLAGLDLHISCQDLQVFAGVSSIGNLQPVRPLDQINAERNVRDWARGQCQGVIQNSLDLIGDTTMNGCSSYHHALALYMAFLSVWAVYVTRRQDLEDETGEQPQGTVQDMTTRFLDWMKEPMFDIRIEIKLLATSVLPLLMSRPEEDLQSAWKLIDRIAAK